MLKGLIPFLKASEIKELVQSLAEQIQRDYAEEEELILICPLRGSVFFLSDLVRQFKIPLKVDFVLIEGSGEQGFVIKKDISLNIKGKHVLIVEEIIDSGIRLSFLKERIKLAFPASLKTVALLDKSSHRNTWTHADYIGRAIDDRFIVGYGMDMDGEGRNYPDMYHLGQ